MDVAQRPLCVGVERPGVRLVASDIGVNGGGQARFPKLFENDASEPVLTERR